MDYFYAQIDSNAVCYAILQTHAPIEQPDMVALDAYDEAYLGKRWTGSAWESPAAAPAEP